MNLAKCRYFIDNLRNSPSTAAMVQNNYCRNKFTECARFVAFEKLGEARVPRDLSPSETERVETLIKG
jgi:hypothetical protein